MKRIIALVITVAILALLFFKVDRAALLANIRATHWGWFAAAIFMFVPQVWAIALRWRWMVGMFAPMPWRESVRLILASNTMNLVLPSKLGDLSKGVFLKTTGVLDLKRAMNIVVFEKMLDVAALALMMLGGVAVLFATGQLHAGTAKAATGLQLGAAIFAAMIGLAAVSAVAILYFVPMEKVPILGALLRGANERSAAVSPANPSGDEVGENTSSTNTPIAPKSKLAKIGALLQSTHEVVALLQSKGARRGKICALSLLIWVFHLAQIYFFFRCLGADAPMGQFVSLVPLAIFIGLLPLSIAGFGTRDAALIQFFPQFGSSVMLAVALYVNLRYILPAIAGLPFLSRYIGLAKEAKAARGK